MRELALKGKSLQGVAPFVVVRAELGPGSPAGLKRFSLQIFAANVVTLMPFSAPL